MNGYLQFFLILVFLFPSLFSWFLPFFCLAFIFLLITRPQKIAEVINSNIAIGFFIFLLTGVVLLIINYYLFENIKPWTYWIAGFSSWFLIVILLRTLNDISKTIHQSLLIAGAIIGFGNLVYIILFLSGLVKESISILGYRAYFGIDSRGFFAYSTSHVPLIAYFTPYFVCHLAAKKSYVGWFEKATLLALILAGLLSLQSFIWLVLIFLLIYYTFLTGTWLRLFKLLSILILMIFALDWYIGIDYEISRGIYELKWSDKINGNDIRFQQLFFWLESFVKSPLIGHGLTSVEIILYDIATGELVVELPGPIVSPFGYEILFAKLLSDIGLLLFIYIFVFAWLSFFIRTKCENFWQVHALRVAAIILIIQSMTNSYLQTSGMLFIFMLPMLFITTNKRSR